MTEPVITVTNCDKTFQIRTRQNHFSLLGSWWTGRGNKRTFKALDGMNLEVKRGERLGIIGMNGSGKSTLLKCLAGICEPNSGTIQVHGRVGSLIELGAGFHPELTGYENIFLNGSIMGLSRVEIEDRMADIIAFSELENFMEMPVKFYSSGMFVRLGFAIAIQLKPDILLLDETLSVGDMAFQTRALKEIENFQETGATILMVSHNIYAVRTYSDRVLWIQDGKARLLGDPYEVVNAYQDFISDQVQSDIDHFLSSHGDALYDDIQADNAPMQIQDLRVASQLGNTTVELDYLCRESVQAARVRVAFLREPGREVLFEADSALQDKPFHPEREGSLSLKIDTGTLTGQPLLCKAALYEPGEKGALWDRQERSFDLKGCPLPPNEDSPFFISRLDAVEHSPGTES